MKDHRRSSGRLRHISRTALLCALLCILSVITLPIGTIPVTLSLLGVLLAGLMLPPSGAFAAALSYLLLGAVGLPVFSSMQGGIGVLFSVTGGYLAAYPPAAWSCAVIAARARKLCRPGTLRYTAFLTAGCLSALLIIDVVGCAWYMFVTGTSLLTGFLTCVLPFLPFDVCKVILALSIVTHAKYVPEGSKKTKM